MPICPKCGKSEYVRISGKKGNRALCENCELFFDAEPGQPGKAKRLRLFLSYPHITEGSFAPNTLQQFSFFAALVASVDLVIVDALDLRPANA